MCKYCKNTNNIYARINVRTGSVVYICVCIYTHAYPFLCTKCFVGFLHGSTDTLRSNVFLDWISHGFCFIRCHNRIAGVGIWVYGVGSRI